MRLTIGSLLEDTIDGQWLQRVVEALKQASSQELPLLAAAFARRMPELLEYLARSQSLDEWEQCQKAVLKAIPHFPSGAPLAADFHAAWYQWLCAAQKGRTRQHKGAPAYNVALFTLMSTGDRSLARRWARIALIEDTLRGGEPRKAMAAWMLQAMLHEPPGEIDALIEFVRDKARSHAEPAVDAIQDLVLWYPDQLLAEYVATTRPIRTTECDLFEPNPVSLLLLWENVTKASEKTKGSALETFAHNLFASVNGFEIRSVRERTKSAENDIVVRNLVARDPIVQAFGHYILVECKNWDKPAGARVIRELVARVRSLSGRCGVLMSSKGVTGSSRARSDADLEIVKAFHRDEVYIMLLTQEDLRSIVEGLDNLLKLMVAEYERIKFDRQTRWGVAPPRHAT